MASRRLEKAAWELRGRTTGRESEPRRLGSRESALVGEVRRHLRAHRLGCDERGFPIDQSPLTARDRPRRLASD